jgi:hypothetical protein
VDGTGFSVMEERDWISVSVTHIANDIVDVAVGKWYMPALWVSEAGSTFIKAETSGGLWNLRY